LTSPVLQTIALACERDLRLLFENFELRLAGGDMVQISGPNGSGKTSLLRLLAGLMQPTDGQVLLNGQPLTEQRHELARNLLSAGQQRRVALARLYLDSPPLWILDEPFTALDKQGVAQLEEHLAGHCERGGLVVLTTHHTLSRMPAGYRDIDLGKWAV